MYEFIKTTSIPHPKKDLALVKFSAWGREKTLVFSRDPRETLTGLNGEQDFNPQLWQEFTEMVMNSWNTVSKQALLYSVVFSLTVLTPKYGASELERLGWVIDTLIAEV